MGTAATLRRASRTVLTSALVMAASSAQSLAGSTPITVETGKPVPVGRMHRADLAAATSGHTAKVTFLRDKGSALGLSTYKISVDGKLASEMHAGEFQTFYLVPGAHSFTLEFETPGMLSARIGELQNSVAVSHSYALGHGTVLGDGEAETYRISTSINDFGPRVETVEATNGAPLKRWNGLHGRIEHGRYFAPGEAVAFKAPLAEFVPEIEGNSMEFLRDRFDMEFGRGYVVHIGLEIQAVHYARLAGLFMAPPTDSSAYRAALDRAWKGFVMRGIFIPASDKAEVVHQEHIVDQGKEILFSIVRLPRVSTNLQVKNGHAASLVWIEGDYVVVLRTQHDRTTMAKADPNERAAAALPKLLAWRSELDFKQAASSTSGP